MQIWTRKFIPARPEGYHHTTVHVRPFSPFPPFSPDAHRHPHHRHPDPPSAGPRPPAHIALSPTSTCHERRTFVHKSGKEMRERERERERERDRSTVPRDAHTLFFIGPLRESLSLSLSLSLSVSLCLSVLSLANNEIAGQRADFDPLILSPPPRPNTPITPVTSPGSSPIQRL
jgi:hypothetical protein